MPGTLSHSILKWYQSIHLKTVFCRPSQQRQTVVMHFNNKKKAIKLHEVEWDYRGAE
jgi:hypothetical protein